MPKVQIACGDFQIRARLRDTPTARAIIQALPLESTAQTWGDEVYFGVPGSSQPEADVKNVVESGEIAFWVQGKAIAIGFGPTPISREQEIRLAAPCNVWADALDDVTQLKDASSGDAVRLSLVSE
jgi:hypothetical protein